MASMLDCKNIQSHLGEYVDGALDADTAWRVKLHLGGCAVCAQAASELQGTIALLQSLPRQETSAGFERALARRLADVALQPRRPSVAERLRDWWTLPSLRPATLATAGALAALVPAAFFFAANQGANNLGVSASRVPIQRTDTHLIQARATTAPDFVQQCLDEHTTYAAADPLGDQSAVLLASLSPATAGAGEDR